MKANIQDNNETIKSITLQLEKVDRQYPKSTTEKTENNLKAHEEKIKKKTRT